MNKRKEMLKRLLSMIVLFGILFMNIMPSFSLSGPEVEKNVYIAEDPDVYDGYHRGSLYEDVNGKIVFTGEFLRYVISVRNDTEETKNYKIIDNLPAGTEIRDYWNEEEPIINYEENSIEWNLRLRPGDSYNVYVIVKVLDEAAETELKNKANVYKEEVLIETNEVVSKVVKRPTKRVYNENNEEIDGKYVKIGDILTYEIEVTNPTNTKKVLTVEDRISYNLDLF